MLTFYLAVALTLLSARMLVGVGLVDFYSLRLAESVSAAEIPASESFAVM